MDLLVSSTTSSEEESTGSSGSSSGYQTDSSTDELWEEEPILPPSTKLPKTVTFQAQQGDPDVSSMITGVEIPPFELVKRVGYSRDISYAGAFLVSGVILLILTLHRMGTAMAMAIESPRLLLALVLPTTFSAILGRIEFEMLWDSQFALSLFAHRLGSFSLILIALWMLWSGFLVYALLAAVLLVTAVADLLRSGNLQDKLQFSNVLLETAREELSGLRAVRRLQHRVLLAQWVLFVAWSLVFFGTVVDSTLHPLQFGFFSLFELFVLIWASQTLRAFTATVASGVFVGSIALGVGQSAPVSQGVGANPARSRAKALEDLAAHLTSRSLTSSAGSMCAGGLLSSFADVCFVLIRPVQALQSSAIRAGPRSALAKVLLGVIERTNTLGWARVAIRGAPFQVSSRDTWRVLESSGLAQAVLGDVTGRLLVSYAYTAAILATGLAMWVIGYDGSDDLVATEHLGTRHAPYMVAVLYMSYSAVSQGACVAEAVVKAIYVCFAERPEALQLPHPIVAHRLARLAEVHSFTQQVP